MIFGNNSRIIDYGKNLLFFGGITKKGMSVLFIDEMLIGNVVIALNHVITIKVSVLKIIIYLTTE
ncbi:hypothetical protein IEI_04991 [Bacillus wiedmannii]|nr:hypothetical protein IEI_04991 [Bacillus wiedmannii]SCN10540.1 Uncharacterized protein BCINRASA_05969 [Bacillus wiedmannii]SCV23673.1 Uncharacterized protein BCRIVMBC845_06266 [Bacillus cereus]